MSVTELRPRKARANDETFRLAEELRRDHVYAVPHGVSLEDVLQPDHWRDVARTIKPGDIIDARPVDNSYRAFLWVVSNQHMLVHVEVMFACQPKTKPAPASEEVESLLRGYKVEHVRGVHRWRVVSPAGEVLSHGHATQGDAERARADILTRAA